jgi:hypothetical protein
MRAFQRACAITLLLGYETCRRPLYPALCVIRRAGLISLQLR